MGRASRYQTRQGAQILDYLSSLKGEHVTAAAIAGRFEDIGKTTVYRHLDKLVEAGMVRRYFLEGKDSACYQYTGGEECGERFHLKCESCGDLIHLNCDVLTDVADHVMKDHRFAINPLKTVFYGTCGSCLSKTKPPAESGNS
ncbi:MAG: transcriptional repressor [Treponema sp.]|jgi:Fur family ferric uptake transcriptional regulator|nr:transcriptional repressor [Treponema sp.]